MKHIDVHNGFIKAYVSRKQHLTLVIEGQDQDGPSVAGVMLTLPQLDDLITRLTNCRQNLRRYLGVEDENLLSSKHSDTTKSRSDG